MSLNSFRIIPWLLASATSTGWTAFTAQTEIMTPQGLRPISQLHVGDAVVSIREGQETLRRISSLSHPLLKQGVVLQTEGGAPLLCSSDQLFWTLRGWQTAEELECGEEILTAEGRWIPLVFPPLTHSLQAVELSLEAIEGDLSANERIFWAGPQRLLCHNDLFLVPLITISLSTGQVATISGLALLSAAAAYGSWWLASELETRLNRLGFPNAHILSIETIWMEPKDADQEHLCLQLFEPRELKPWFEQPNHEFGLHPIPSEAFGRSASMPLQWAHLPPETRDALVQQIERAVLKQGEALCAGQMSIR